MKNKKFYLITISLLLCLFVASLVLVGCKCPFKKSEKSMAMEQTTCPVSGQPIDKKYHTVYKGKTVYFCCPNCPPIFEKNPEKYIDKLPQFKSETPQVPSSAK